jgi:outer membrane receptor protein involved in Fe transport
VVAAQAWAAIKQPTHIEAQELGAALEVLAREHGFQLLYRTELVRGLQAHELRGNLTTEQALQQLLNGTGLTYRYLGEQAVTIVPVSGGAMDRTAIAFSSAEQPAALASAAASSTDGQGAPPLRRSHMAQAAQAVPSAGSPPADQDSQAPRKAESSKLEEVTVTAQRRTQNIQDVPMSVSVISGKTLEDLGATTLQDYAGYLPGLTLVPGPSPGQDQIIMRGLNMPGAGSGLNATYIDDSPITFSHGTPVSLVNNAFNLVPYDLSRIEAEFGPQGTLYGANAMGGVLKYVTRQPDWSDLSFRMGADGQRYHDGGYGEDYRGMVNAPLVSGVAAIRESVAINSLAGYFDYPNEHVTDGNRTKEKTTHTAIRWKLADNWTLDVNALLQWSDTPRIGYTTLYSNGAPIYGKFIDGAIWPGSSDQRLQFYSVAVSGNLGWAKLVSASSFELEAQEQALPQLTPKPCCTPPSVPSQEPVGGLSIDGKKYTQEFRLASVASSPFEWMGGVFYTKETQDLEEPYYCVNSAGAVVTCSVPSPGGGIPADDYQEAAFFTNDSYRLTDSLQITAGLRGGRNWQSFTPDVPVQQSVGNGQNQLVERLALAALAPPSPSPQPSPPPPKPIQYNTTTERGSESYLIYSVEPQYRFSQDAMAYIRVATGYRPGSPNIVTSSSVPQSVQSDSVLSYEIGSKTGWLDRKLQIDLAAYLINWEHIQFPGLNTQAGGYPFTVNGPTARVEGGELGISYSPPSGPHLAADLVLTNAYLTTYASSGAGITGKPGDALPQVPRWSAATTMDYAHPLFGAWSGTFGVGWHYTGERYIALDDPANCPAMCAGLTYVPKLRAYGSLDAHVGIGDSKWNLRLYGRNLTNEYVLVYMSNGNGLPLPPRLIGLSIDRAF